MPKKARISHSAVRNRLRVVTTMRAGAQRHGAEDNEDDLLHERIPVSVTVADTCTDHDHAARMHARYSAGQSASPHSVWPPGPASWRRRQMIATLPASIRTHWTERRDRQLQDDGDPQQVRQRRRHQHLPGEAQHLVDAEAGPRAANPHQQEDDEHGLDDEVERPQRRHLVAERPAPAAQEQGRGDGRNGEQVAVLGDVEPAELQPAVLDEVAGDDFRVGFEQVERRAARLPPSQRRGRR